MGLLDAGVAYYAPIGEMRYERDRAQCHLCGRWLKMVGGSHLLAAHDMTLQEYREMFRLLGTVTTAAPDTSELKRERMLEQFATGQRVIPDPDEAKRRRAKQDPSVARWRSLASLRPDLTAELHPSRNGEDLDPHKLGQRSHRKLWWRCDDCGHEWQTSPNERTSAGRGCPACGKRRSIAAAIERNRRPIARERSLAALHPRLLAEWHPTRNGDLDPHLIAAGSDRKIWWQCVECGNEWSAAANDRTRRRSNRAHPHGCPACARAAHITRQAIRALTSRESSFGALYPHLVPEWHRTRNLGLDPYAVKPGSDRKVWWQCAECGQEWQATPAARSRSPRGGCRSCATTRAQLERWAQARRTAAENVNR